MSYVRTAKQLPSALQSLSSPEDRSSQLTTTIEELADDVLTNFLDSRLPFLSAAATLSFAPLAFGGAAAEAVEAKDSVLPEAMCV